MKKAKEKIAVVIGRFAPFHNGHAKLMNYASRNFDYMVVLVGSADRARDLYVPWTAGERIDMIRLNYPNILKIKGIRDYPYPYHNKKWVAQVRDIVDPISRKADVTLISNSHDGYTNFFPDWKVERINTECGVNATMIRELFFGQTIDGSPIADSVWKVLLKELVPDNTFVQMDSDYGHADWYKQLRMAYQTACENRANFGEGPHLCTDYLVTWNRHVLLVTRGGPIGKGLLALPGGYLDKRYTLAENAVKELVEETGFERELIKDVEGPFIFDGVNRSSANRNVTAVYTSDIKSKTKPVVRGMDDASRAHWYLPEDVMPNAFHDDHFHILENVLHARKQSHT